MDFLFPKYCVSCKRVGSYLCARCFSYLSFDTKGVCLVCERFSIGGLTHPGCLGKFTIDGTFASIVYQGVAKKLLYTFKYKPYVTDLKNLLIELFYEGLIQKEVFYLTYKTAYEEKGGMLVPIPLSLRKQKERGYNQAKILAGGLAKKFQLEVIDCLERIKETMSQMSLDREKRKKNVSDAFRVQEQLKKHLKGKTVFLVDDVLTTGATLSEAANVLKRAGAKKVFGLTLARGK